MTFGVFGAVIDIAVPDWRMLDCIPDALTIDKVGSLYVLVGKGP